MKGESVESHQRGQKMNIKVRQCQFKGNVQQVRALHGPDISTKNGAALFTHTA